MYCHMEVVFNANKIQANEDVCIDNGDEPFVHSQ